LDDKVIVYYQELYEYHLTPWAKSGFISIQNWIDNIILTTLVDSDTISPSITLVYSSLKVPGYVNDDIGDVLSGNMATYIVLPLIIVFLRMTHGLLLEKQNKIKEGMKIMGMNDTSFYLSWIIEYEIIYLIISLIVTGVLKASVFKNVIYNFFI
jgi:ATP-binding cassette subfamily A (ABC1) protein 3